MQAPFIVAILSIIPGLGFFALKKIQAGIAVWGLLFLCVAVLNSSTTLLIYTLAFGLFFLIWIAQIGIAYRFAKLQKEEAEELARMAVANRECMVPIDLVEENFAVRNAYDILKQMTDPGEQIYQTVLAFMYPSVRPFFLYGSSSLLTFQQRIIGFTSKGIVMVRTDNMGKPVELSRMDYSEIKSMQHKKRFVLDRVRVYKTEKSGMTWFVSFFFRTQIKKMIHWYAAQPREE